MIIEKIKIDNIIQAIIFKTKARKFDKGTKFITPTNFSFQIGQFNLNKNYSIQPHMHKKNERKITDTSEVLFIKSGILRVDFYNRKKKYLFSELIKENDFIMFNKGAHGFKVIKKVEMIEIKQGPFKKNKDKLKFKGINETKIRYR